jgi:hypothetical protein
MNSSTLAVPVIFTDPSYIKTRADRDENILPDTAGDATHKSPGNYVKLSLDKAAYDSLRNTRLQPSREGDEMLLVIGDLHPLKEYEYVGSHHSDSGLACIIHQNSYSEEGCEELDWVELVAATLDNSKLDLDAFPLLDFCAPIPEDDSVLAIFGKKSDSHDSNGVGGDGDGCYSSVVMRAWCKAFPHEVDE